jgi:alpha-beta hydrolase superfamily lysophospholipase
MSQHPLDAPQITSSLFFPRRTVPQKHPDGAWQDGTVKVDDEVAIGYRFYIHQKDSPVILFFHGNGEVVSDYMGISQEYHNWANASLLVVDYRGYGWSTGKPLTSKMLPDAKIVLDKIPQILEAAGVNPNVPLFIKGRSLGSAPAIYLGLVAPDKFNGMIIESGYADAPSLFRRLGITIPDNVKADNSLPINNAEKMKNIHLPLLVIHGELDNLIPMWHGEKIHTNSPTEDKQLVVIPGAGHNNLMAIDSNPYFSAIAGFVNNHLG